MNEDASTYAAPEFDPGAECTRPPAGWYCTRGLDHAGPCAARPTREGAIALLRLGLQPEPARGPYRAVESPDTPGHWRILDAAGEIAAVVPGRGGQTAEQVAATAWLLAASWTLLVALDAEHRQNGSCPCGVCDQTRAAIARARGLGCTVDAVAGTFLCHSCGQISHQPQDAAQLYCGHCHLFFGGEMATR